MKSKKAFTLIELLVVIAIIALLLSIIMPALRKVKKQAASIVCLANMKSMVACWHTYAMDNSEKMVNGQVPLSTTLNNGKPSFWVEAPQDRTGAYTGGKPGSSIQLPIEEEQNGIRKGLLYPYLDSVDVYHCPSENGKKIYEDSASAAYGSFWNCYSITGLMNGESSKETYLIYNPGSNPVAGTHYDKNAALKITEVVSPGSKIVFLENGDSRGFAMGSWLMNYVDPKWVDPFTIWHGNQSPLGFADGHGENHRWVDDITLKNATLAYNSPELDRDPVSSGQREDIDYFNRRYVPGRGR